MIKPPKDFVRARDVFNSLPEIGPITAERIVQYLILNPDRRESLIKGLINLENVGICKTCGLITDEEECGVCKDGGRENVVVVVKSPFEVFKIEESGKFRGRYFVVYNLLSPAEGISTEKIPKDEFVRFVKRFNINEVIVALPNDVKGEVTAYFLLEDLEGVKATKIPSGVPRGEDISSLDPYTLYEAIEHRVPFEV